MTPLRRHRCNDHVGTGTDQGTIAAEAGSQGKGPPQRVEIGHTQGTHILYEGNHSRHEGNIVNKGRCNGAHPQYEHGRRIQIAVRDFHGFCCHGLDDTRIDEPADENE